MAFQVIITRGDAWDTAYEIWTKLGAAPLEYGDGTYLDTVQIEPWETQVLWEWTPAPPAGQYGFLIAPLQRRDQGIFTLIPPTSVP